MSAASVAGPLWISLQVAGAAALVSSIAGIAIGGLLASRRTPLRELLDVLLTAPLVLPPTVLGWYLLVALGRRSPLGHAIEAVFGAPLVFTRAGAVVAATAGALPIVIKSSRAALESVDPLFLDAARTLGATPLRAFVAVRLPLAARGIAAGILLCFARALGDFGATLMVAGDIPGTTRTASLAIYDALQAGQDAQAAGLVAVLTAVALAALFGANRLAGFLHGR